MLQGLKNLCAIDVIISWLLTFIIKSLYSLLCGAITTPVSSKAMTITKVYVYKFLGITEYIKTENFTSQPGLLNLTCYQDNFFRHW